MSLCDLTNKVAIITGASSGLGQATAVLFARMGASVVLCGRDENRLIAAVDQCKEESPGQNEDRFISMAGDVNDSKVRQSIVDVTIKTFGKLDILVANAGIMLEEGTLHNTTEETFDAMFNTNVKSVFFLIQAAVDHLEKSGGSIVCVSSVASSIPIGQLVIYPMTKAALDHLTTCLSLSLAPKGIRVNSVNPSYVATRLVRPGCQTQEDVEAKSGYLKYVDDPNHPLHGECVTAKEVANAIAFLASDAARCSTGQHLVIDNGRRFQTVKIQFP